ncbi:hypothetical protein JFK97_20785 [Chromobacterium phragmitis]|uniref:hypothetical protein n=1 Tax=Chromobacterium amazonense TaxID=1382803 RepID=UPI0021B783F8|nr:hypothetical protein [Chromobacterium amazonense]MBM2886822.1 hypothetical protein [Chromobacterium amazonense]MDE1712025.1 hypothetical protein [Chromobacterium amazonense]
MKREMTSSNHAPRQPVKEFLRTLHANFGHNAETIGPDACAVLDTIDLNSRIISEIRTILAAGYCETDGQKKICTELLEEVFTDFSLAMYLCTIGLIVPARMSVRRGFELALATVYMWDLPHEYWGWRNRDQDLSFSAMVTHLNSVGYLEYLAQLHKVRSVAPICDQAKFQGIYRELSNTVHGKISELPALSPARFVVDKNGVEKHLKATAEAQLIIIQLFFGRFQELQPKIEAAFPQIKRV